MDCSDIDSNLIGKCLFKIKMGTSLRQANFSFCLFFLHSYLVNIILLYSAFIHNNNVVAERILGNKTETNNVEE